MFRAALTAIFCGMTFVVTTDLGYHPVSKIGLIACVILGMYSTKIADFFFDESDAEAMARRQKITRKDSLKIEDSSDPLLQGYNFLWEED